MSDTEICQKCKKGKLKRKHSINNKFTAYECDRCGQTVIKES